MGVAGLLLVGGRQLAGVIPAFAEAVRGLGVLGPVVFILGYALGTVALVPGALLTLAAGAVFGVTWGTIYVAAGATMGMAGAFLISRHLARDAASRRLAGRPGLAAIDEAIGREGLKIVFLLRLSPAFPFSVMNYALGLTRVRFRDYLLASVGILPGTVLYTYAGRVAGDLAMIAAGDAPVDATGNLVLLGVGFAATILVTVVLTRTARRALATSTGAHPA